VASPEEVLDVLARRGCLALFDALTGPALTERAIVSRLAHVNPSVVVQRLNDLQRLGVVEVVPESGDYRLSPRGRRLQGLLDQLGRWAEA
jgi:DNA-binding HxlR family transcriptional regulator